MKQIFKLYSYYLKRLLKSWYFWFSVIILLLIAFGVPYWAYLNTGKYNINSNEFIKNKDLFPEYKDFLKERFFAFSSSEKRNIFSPISDFFMLDKGDKLGDILSTTWKLFSFWMMNVFSFFTIGFSLALAVPASISKPISDGEDKTVLNVASPIKRTDLIISKIWALFTYFLIFSSLIFVLPAFFYYCLVIGFSAKIGLIFLLTTIFLFPLLHFLFFAAPLILVDMVSAALRWIFVIFLIISPGLWGIIEGWWGDKEIVQKIGKAFGSNFLVIIPCALLIGGLCLFAYQHLFRKKDFN